MDYFNANLDVLSIDQYSPWMTSRLNSSPSEADLGTQSQPSLSPASSSNGNYVLHSQIILSFMDAELWDEGVLAKAKDTEVDIVISPRDFWDLDLQDKINKLVENNRVSHPAARVHETSLVVSVNKNHEFDLAKRAEELKINRR
ncbi:hypothetical protein BKA67DRAFT_663941 [Truncatella angustata]|uniref:Uncharacterized protein n=1 Tax=Truncatella angustata TaxID=152316 RepID=A0A9P8RHR2_9PEZI|nr:uncharacterized protein BKA67DRAFT_663941 [Truncatella angustata]KAH6646077.1 hypothetical protein BKA67DRAFT_663941 [Truncatella angustata]KAH8194118.1 hypothetical protein TruAng_011711 [Truncatella angustata]